MERWLIVLALAACRDKPATPSAAPAPEIPPEPHLTQPPARPVPVLPAVIDGGIDPRGLPPEQAFGAERADPAWQQSTERTLRGHLHQTASQIECRQTICQVTIIGSEAELSRATSQLQELRELAQSVVLTQPEQRDGKLALRAYVRFERADSPDSQER